MMKVDGRQQCNNQPTKGSAKAGGGGCGDSDSGSSSNDGNATATLMEGNGRCNGSAMATTVMEGGPEKHNADGDGR